MATNIYDPKELLNVLIKVERELEDAMDKYCCDSRFSIDTDVDKTLESFFKQQGVKGNEVGFLSTHIALAHLCREIEKTRSVVVDTNNLRAWEDFVRLGDGKETTDAVVENRAIDRFMGTKLNYAMLVITLLSVILTGYFVLFSK